MRQTAYEYFKNLYRDYDGVAVCIDDMLRVLYCTKSSYQFFNIGRDLFTNLNCVLSVSVTRIIEDIVREPRCCTFNFIIPSSGGLCTCTVTPVHFGKIYYFLLAFTMSDSSTTENQQQFYTQTWCNVNLPKLTQAMNYITSFTAYSKDGDVSGAICSNIRKMRKMISQLEIITNGPPNTKNNHSTELNCYITHILDIITKKLGRAKINFKYSKTDAPLISHIPYDHLDIVFCNIATTAIRSFGTGVTVDVALFSIGDSNIIMFSVEAKGSIGMRRLIQNGNRHQAPADSDILPFAVISCIAKANGGEVRLTETPGGTMAFTLMLPKDTSDSPLLYSCDEREDPNDSMSLVSIQLSDI